MSADTSHPGENGQPTRGKPVAPKPFTVPSSKSGHNMGSVDRALSSAIGGALVLIGLKRRSPTGSLLALVGGALVNQGVTGHSHLYQRFGINTAPRKFPALSTGSPALDRTPATVIHAPDLTSPDIGRTVEVESLITIGKPASELYDIWRDPKQLALIMKHFAKVTAPNTSVTHWSIPLPAGHSLEWDTRIVEEHPDEVLCWESVPDAALTNIGEVRFRPASGDQGTEVRLRFRFAPPGGALGEVAAKLLHIVPGSIATKTLRSFKALAETGGIPSVEHNVSGRTNPATNAS